MSDQDDALAIRRIMVAIDASHHSLAALEAAAELAAALEAHIEGVFVEDARLLRMADHPVAREVPYPFVSTATLSPARMRRQLRAQATEARLAVLRICEARELEWSFRVVRGDVVAAVLRAAQHADLLSLGIASRPLSRRVRLGSTAHAAAARATTSVLVSQRGLRIKAPIMVVYDGSPAAVQALSVVLLIAKEPNHYLSIALVADGAEATARLRREVARRVRNRAAFTRYRVIPDARARTLITAVEAENCGLLVLCGACTPPDEFQPLLNTIECPVLMIR
jgi:nucleotide-binding universal stress UspA family protein